MYVAIIKKKNVTFVSEIEYV